MLAHTLHVRGAPSGVAQTHPRCAILHAMAKNAPAERLRTHFGDVDLCVAEGYFGTPMGTSTAVLG
jgi:hypothetical protein